MSLAILFHFLCAQHVSDINISIIRSLRLCCWITTSVVLFSVRCVFEIWCGWFRVVPMLQAEASARKTNTTQNQPHQISNTQRTENKTTDVVIQQHSRKLLMMDILMSETCWAHKKWNKIASDIKLVFYSSTITLEFASEWQGVTRSNANAVKPEWLTSAAYLQWMFQQRTRNWDSSVGIVNRLEAAWQTTAFSEDGKQPPIRWLEGIFPGG